MNIFMLDRDVRKCAQYTADKHVVKMITETAQILNSAYYFTGEHALASYRLSHANHPCCVWARQSVENWRWLHRLGLALYDEYQFRYMDRTHKAGEVIKSLSAPKLPQTPYCDPPLCMPDAYKSGDAVKSYRAYYMGEKAHILRWTRRGVPYWTAEYWAESDTVGETECTTLT